MKRVRYGDCRASLIVPIPFNQEHENMLRLLQTFVSTNKLMIHPTMEEVIISLKSAKNKLNQPYSLDKTNSAFHDTLDALRLSLCGMELKT